MTSKAETDEPATLIDPWRARRRMEARGIDVLVGAGYVNYGYIAGYFTHFGRDYPGPLYNGLPMVRFAGLPRDAALPPFLVTYPGEEGDIHVQGTWIEDRRFWGPKYNVPGRASALRVNEDPYLTLADALDERGLAGGAVGISMTDVSVPMFERLKAALPQASLIDASGDFDAIRMVKTPEEIRRLLGAVASAERGHMAVRERLREGMTGMELAAEVKRAVTDARTDRYIVHVSAGALGSVVLAATADPLPHDSIISVDVGALHQDYCGDMFRVYAFGNAPSDAFDIHDRLDEVNAQLIDAVRPGVTASELYHLGRGEMERRGLELALDFVGHGLGIDVHERPYLVATDHTPLEPDMVVVLEVSTRRSDLGHLCAEITCLVTKDGCEVLNTLPYTITHVR